MLSTRPTGGSFSRTSTVEGENFTEFPKKVIVMSTSHESSSALFVAIWGERRTTLTTAIAPTHVVLFTKKAGHTQLLVVDFPSYREQG